MTKISKTKWYVPELDSDSSAMLVSRGGFTAMPELDASANGLVVMPDPGFRKIPGIER